ncbi:hypothetical protein [Burkholderia sp. TSV86]|uniref:hypothetical protein n=1 Tax=Burkholderia sp. TSV86 TaxID=1385594 RepID=UPI00075CA579|nr:hypothetical protein [Burkholderia sp. TSV86]KVE33247.1 hypothetical protein WS68_12570 [Burkholderia sp. TSV86]
MRHRSAMLAAVVCAASLLTACSDDASEASRAQANAATQQPPFAKNGADAFNGGAPAGGNLAASAPLAPPVIHYPPEDADEDASGAKAALMHSASSPR